MLNSTYPDRNAVLAGLLATATVVLNTDRRAAKSCIRHAVELLGIDLSLGGAVAAEHSYLPGGLAPGLGKVVHYSGFSRGLRRGPVEEILSRPLQPGIP